MVLREQEQPSQGEWAGPRGQSLPLSVTAQTMKECNCFCQTEFAAQLSSLGIKDGEPYLLD